MSSENKPTFEEFYKNLNGNMNYALNGLCEMYTKHMKIELMDPYDFLMLPEIRKNFDIYRVSRLYMDIIVLKKKY